MIHQPKNLFFITCSVCLCGVIGLIIVAGNGCNGPKASATDTTRPQSRRQPEASMSPTLDSIVIRSGQSKAVSRKVVAIHGLGDSPEHFSMLFKERPLPADIVLPRASTRFGPGGSWFDVAIPVRDTPKHTLKKDVAQATQTLCQFISGPQFDRPPVVTGFSQGGILTFSMAVTCPDKVHAAVPVSGLLAIDTVQGTDLPPIVALHGTDDETVDYARGKESVRKLQQMGANAEFIEFQGISHSISPQMHQVWFDTIEKFLKE